jgi:hypothetical protein
MRKYDERFFECIGQRERVGKHHPNRKMTFLFEQQRVHQAFSVVINGFSVVNGVYGIGHHAFWRNSFRPKLNEYKIYYMKVVEFDETGEERLL